MTADEGASAPRGDSPGAAPGWLACVDAGNSRAKLYAVDLELGAPGSTGAPRAVCTWESQAQLPAAWDHGPRFCALSSVASPERTEALRAELEVALACPVLVNPESGLLLRIRHAETVGADRLFAARGAQERLAPGPARGAIVVDAGTALTVDAIRFEGPQGVFLGGAIAPGPALLASALAAGGARLHGIEPAPGVPALGRETSEALRAGVVVGFEGAALRLVQRVSAEAQLAGAPVLLTGGAADFLEAPLRGELAGVERIPELVPEGLLAAWRDAWAAGIHGR